MISALPISHMPMGCNHHRPPAAQRASAPPPETPAPEDPTDDAATVPDAPTPVPGKPLGSFENRRCPRFRRDSIAQLITWPATRRVAPIDVTVVDYSATGLGVVHDEAVLVGSTFIVREPFVTANSTCMYTVARCNRRPDGKYSIGLHACNTLTDDLEPKEDHVRPPGRWVCIAFLAFALLGTATIVAISLVR